MTQISTHDASDDVELLKSAAVAAGIIALGYFRRDVKTWAKENSSPVTEADFLIDKFLGQTLSANRPDYGWMSEETADDLVRLEKKRIFVVDPIDGTRGFIRGDDSWSICIAVVENGVAISGVIYAPARDELYEAVLGEGARLNGQALKRVSSCQKKPKIPAIGAVRSELQAAGLAFEQSAPYPSLAYQLVQVATGNLDVAIARRGAQDWDIAAASVILGECGLVLDDVCSGPPKFNQQETRHGALAALRDNSLRAIVHGALKRVYGCPQNSIKTEMEPTK